MQNHSLSIQLFPLGKQQKVTGIPLWLPVSLLIMLCSFMHSINALAQETPGRPVTVRGKVTDASGSPLENATVQSVKGNSSAVTTADGSFSITLPEPGKIRVSMVGYANKEVSVSAGGGELTIQLESSSKTLDDIVVIGYGTQRKGEVTSAVASVKSDEFVKGFARDPAQLIQGKVAGLAVVTPSGNPNDNTQISLRGITTLTSSTSPLVLIDGIPGNLNTVAPEDIESIDVLKDGSAAAIYGTRGTNGVILITTRKKRGNMPASLSYDGYVSVQTIARKMEFLTAADYRRLIASGDLPANKDLGGSTDWLDVVTRTPVSHTHNLTYQGGNAQTNYTASLNYRSWEGLFKRSDNQQLIGRIDINHSMLDGKLKFNLNAITRSRKYFNSPNWNYIYRQAIIRNPTDSVFDYRGQYKEDPNGYFYDNPLRPINETQGENRVNELRLNGNVVFTPIKDLNIKLLVSGNKTNELSGYYETFNHRASVVNGRTGYASRVTRFERDNLMEFTTDYSKSIRDHRFTILGGYSYQYVSAEGFNANNSNFPYDAFTYHNLESGNSLYFPQTGPMGMDSYKNDYKLIGFFGRLNYSWNDKYMLMASLRREGSSKFGRNYQWGNFPAISAGWRISKEGFMDNVSFINDLKLRAGFGVTGTVPTDPYRSLATLEYGTRFLYNGVWIQQIAPSQNTNEDLRWEKKEETNIGLDFAVLDSRISGSVDVYQRDTRDMLYNFQVPVPPYLFSSILTNVGHMRNRGVEVLLNFVPVRKQDIEWNTNITYASNKNTLVSVSNDQFQVTNNFITPGGHTGEPIQEYTHRIYIGGPIGDFYGYKSIDIDENGKWIIQGADGKPKPMAQSTPADKMVLGNGIPKHIVGWNHNFRYKRFDLNVTMRGAFEYQILNFQRLYYENPKITNYNMLKSAFDKVYGKTRLTNDLAYVSYYLENGDHWKIDNVTIGYNMNVSKSKYFKNARVYVSGLNMLVITKYKGIDPEVNRIPTSDAAPGNDLRDKYPTTRTFTLGVNLTL